MVKLSIIFAILFCISLLGNFFLIQQTKSLDQELNKIEVEKSEISKQLEQSQNVLQTKIENEPPKNPSSPSPMGATESKSIDAVAVRPILLHDGFFENFRYEGILMKINVIVKDGSGLVLVNTDVPAGVDFQTSAKTSAKVAQEYTGVTLSNKDIIFSITSASDKELQAVDGPSAGGAMTVLLISELQGRSINKDVLMTGTIESEGTIGKVGGIKEKADVAGQNEAKIFLVPLGQGKTNIQNCQESKNGVFTYRSCTLEEKPLSPIMEQKYNMKVVEVGKISDVLEFFK